jgi:hypothetical protein
MMLHGWLVPPDGHARVWHELVSGGERPSSQLRANCGLPRCKNKRNALLRERRQSM